MSKKDKSGNKMHTTDKRVLIGGAVACVVVIAIGIGLRVYLSNREPLPVAPPQSVPPASSQSVDMSKFDVPTSKPVELPKTSESDKIVESTDENGDYLKEQEIGKPAAPSEPPKLAEGADTTNPSTPPEYEQGTNNNPKPGDINSKGETWIPGIGWLGEGSGGRGEVADFDLTGEQVGH